MSLNKESFSEDEIIKGIQSDNPRVVGFLYKKMAPVIYHDVVKNSGTKEDAKDHFQETMLVVSQNIKRGNYKSGNIMGYIKKIAQNLWHKSLRKKGYELTTAYPNESRQEDELNYEKYLRLLKYDEEIELVKHKLEEIGDSCKQVLCMFYYNKTSLQEIADHFDWSYNYCKKKIYNCRIAMKELLEQENISYFGAHGFTQ